MVRNERYDFNISGKIILPHNKVEKFLPWLE